MTTLRRILSLCFFCLLLYVPNAFSTYQLYVENDGNYIGAKTYQAIYRKNIVVLEGLLASTGEEGERKTDTGIILIVFWSNSHTAYFVPHEPGLKVTEFRTNKEYLHQESVTVATFLSTFNIAKSGPLLAKSYLNYFNMTMVNTPQSYAVSTKHTPISLRVEFADSHGWAAKDFAWSKLNKIIEQSVHDLEGLEFPRQPPPKYAGPVAAETE